MSRARLDDDTPSPLYAADTDEIADPEGLEALLEFLKRARAFDFSGYKRSSLSRRILRRLPLVGASSYAEYIDYLEVHPDEYPLLFNTILINVTGFFRDAPAWSALALHLRKVVDARRTEDPIRVWSAGCASGEEAYSIATLLADILGVEACVRRVKIYATDLDEEALSQARQASYSAKAVEGVPPATLEKYFTRSGNTFLFDRDLRRCVIFGRHDLVHDAPISRVDLLCCRNTLMYFNAETQTKILGRLHFALTPDGILFLGKAEMLLTHTDLFIPIDLKLRLFQRARRDARTAEAPEDQPPSARSDTTSPDDQLRIYKGTFEATPLARIVLDGAGNVVLINSRAAHAFGLSSRDLGRPFHEIDLAILPVALRRAIDQAVDDRRAMSLKDVERSGGRRESTFIDIDIAPLVTDDGFAGLQVTFLDVTANHHTEAELRRASTELEAAHEELQSTSEELETTNEELQSTVEELETTNEELQSTNEELETTNEELQSTNEELQTMNEELRQRGDELNQLNGFLAAILGSLRAGIVVLDPAFLVKAWNKEMEQLFGLRAEEVEGQNFLNLDIGVPMEKLRESLRAASIGTDSASTVTCTNRRGKTVTCKISVSAMHSDDAGGLLLLFESE